MQKDNQAFSSLGLRDALVNNLDYLEYVSMTPIQAQSLPVMLNNQDVIAQAKTGSGKTAAFGLALLNRLNPEIYAVQALILCPTRELADQVAQALRQLARLMSNVKILNLSGGIPMKPQLDSLKHSPHIVVGTPGRIQKHLDKESLSLKQLQILVLDEADRMLDMGFWDAISNIISVCPKQRQTLLFSATYPDEIKALANKFMRDPKKIIVKNDQEPLDIEQIFYAVNNKNKFNILKNLLLHYKPASVLIFCNTKDQTTQLASMLVEAGFAAIALNGDMEQRTRDIAMIRFKNQSCQILVATDVAARGLDIKELPAVINYDIAFDQEVHIHRIGRTGRAGSKGLALSLAMPYDTQRVEIIEDVFKQPVVWGNADQLIIHDAKISTPEMVTICLNLGRKDKIRAGDILGALTKDAGIDAKHIGKIDITAMYSYVAIQYSQVATALKYFKDGKIKGSRVSARKLT